MNIVGDWKKLHGGDEVMLTKFEALVQAQQPATEAWTPVTDYSFEARTQIEGEHPRLIRDVFEPRYVLDVGCGPEAVLVRLLAELGIETDGIDRNADAATSWCPGWSMPGDIVSMDFEFGQPHDLVICREVLEHLTIRQIRQAVTNLCKLTSRYVYVTTRFAQTPLHLLDVDTADDLDPTHITMLSQPLLRLLFVLEGFKRRADLEAQLDWKHLGRVLVYERA